MRALPPPEFAWLDVAGAALAVSVELPVTTGAVVLAENALVIGAASCSGVIWDCGTEPPPPCDEPATPPPPCRVGEGVKLF